MKNGFRKCILLLMCIGLCLAGCGSEKTPTVLPDETAVSVENELNNAYIQETENSEYSDGEEDVSEENEETSERVLNLDEPAIEAQDQTVTMMIYMIGSDLESKSGAATNDIQEMSASGFDFSKNNILIFTGGCEQWFSDISDEANELYQLTEDGLVKVKEYKSSSMGNPVNLTQFLNYVYENYKTDSYNLILWDHGNGPILGYGKDKLYDNDSLLLSEIRTALENSPFDSSNKLGFIGFDACLMSSAELVCTIADFAEYMVASQEVEPNFGWNYAFLQECGKVSNDSLARLAVYNYVKYASEYFSEHENFCNDVTMACIDLKHADELKRTINGLFDEAIRDVSGSYNVLALERNNTRALGRATTGSEYDLVDIYSLMNAMGEKYSTRTSEVKTVIDDMVCYSADNTTDCCGMSIYYPFFNKNQFEKSWKEAYKEISQFDSYQKYLDGFSQIWIGTEMMSFFDEPLSPEEYTPGSYSLKLSDDQQSCYLSSGYYILRKEGDGVFSVVDYSRDVVMENGVLNAQYDGKTLMISDDYGRKSMIASNVTDVISDSYYHSINIVARDRMYADINSANPYNNVNGEIQLMVNHDSNEVEVAGIYELDDEDARADNIKTGKKQPLDFESKMVWEFDQRVPKYPLRDENGVLRPIDEWLATTISTRDVYSCENGIHFTYEPILDDGYEYFLMFDVMDTQAHHYSSELMPVMPAKGENAIVQITENTYTWNEFDESPEIINGETTFTFFESKDIGNGNADIYGICVTNANDYQIEVEVKDVLVNGVYETGVNDSVNIFAGHQGILKFAGLDRILRYSGSNRLENIRFSYRISDYITGKIVSDWSGVCIEIGENILPHVQAMKCFGASASNQVILDDKIKIELIDGGYYPNSKASDSGMNTFGYRMIINNKSDEPCEISLTKMRFNGVVTITDNESSILDGGRYGRMTLLPGESKYIFVKSLRLDNGIGFTNINSAELILYLTSNETYDEERLVLPVKLDNYQGNQADFIEGHSCVYTDKNIDIYDMGSQSTGMYSTTPVYRSLAVINKSGVKVNIATSAIAKGLQNSSDMVNDEKINISDIRLEEGDRAIMLIRPEDGMTNGTFSLSLNVKIKGEDTIEAEDYVTSMIVLEEEKN